MMAYVKPVLFGMAGAYLLLILKSKVALPLI
jgi:hypothetical protein